MWTLQIPWYELVGRAVLIFIAVMIIMRIWGKKHFSEINPFDFVLFLIISESLQNALIADDRSVPGGIISLTTLVFMNVLSNRIGFFSRKMEKIIEGTPKILIRNGELDQRLMIKESLTMQELHSALRQEGMLEPADVQWGIIEPNGKISLIRKQEKSN